MKASIALPPPPRRGPRFSDPIYVGGIAMAIEALPLYQPDAPKAYLVEAPRGTPRRIAWDGLRWATTTLTDEAHGGHGSLRSLPAAGSIPASSTGCPIKKGVRASLDQVPEKTGADFKRRPVMQPPSEKKALRRSDPLAGASRLVKVKYVNQDGVESSATRLKDAALPSALQALHDRLDIAREKYDKARDAGDGNRMFDLMDEYSACILAVDQADPGFYLGRIKPLDPLPRYVMPDLDYAGISSRMTFPAGFGQAHVGEDTPTATGGICRVCGCTDNDCSGCIERTGMSCYWVEPDLCSACAPKEEA